MNVVTSPRAFARYSHPTQPQNWDEVIANDTRPVLDSVRKFGEPPEGPFEVPTRWYTDQAVFKEEIENLWKKKWQMTCRLNHIPNKGDTYLHEVAGLSFIVVRVDEDTIKGYWNSCLHRGVPLRQCAGRVDRLQCPFHGFTWSLEGKSTMIPHSEDFPHIDPENFSLPEIQIAVWQGYVMINPDLDAEPFDSYIEGLDEQFARFPHSDRELAIHIRKVFPGNWKAVQESFMESFHVLTTHPQQATTDAGDRCNDFGAIGNVSRGVLAAALTSDYVPKTPSENDIYARLNGVWDDEICPEEFILPEGMTARQGIAEIMRDTLRPVYGEVVDIASDTEMADIRYYTIFPNFHAFGLANTLAYHIYPHSSDPDQCILEIYFLAPVAPGQAHKTPPEIFHLTAEEEFVEIEQLGKIGSFLSQDSGNLAGIMTGLRNSQTGYVHFARRHESKLRHFYECYEKSMNFSAADEVGVLKAKVAA